MSRDGKQISRVTRSKADAKTSYDRLSRWYDLIAGWSERKAVECGLKQLHAIKGETVLEIGYGTGRSLVALARAVGETGHIVGIDLSEGMRTVAAKRIVRAGLEGRVDLLCGDARRLGTSTPASKESRSTALSKHPAGLPDARTLTFGAESFDAVFMSFVLELFEEFEMPVLLAECRRVLKSSGRIVVVSMEKKANRNAMVKLYEWAHRTFPKVVDCRPIHADRALKEAGFRVTRQIEMRMWGLPVSIVLANKP